MKILKVFGVSVVTLASIQAQMAVGSWLDGAPYVSGGAGYTVYDNIDDLTSNAQTVKDFADSTHLTKNAFGFIGFAGWAFHGGYSLEVSYADFGEFEADALFGNLDESLAGSMTAKGFGMRYDWYEMDAMSVYGRIGVMRWETTWDVDIVNLDTSTTERISSNTNGSEFYVGLGGQYELMKNIYAYAEAFYLDAKYDQDGFGSKQPVYAVFGGLMIRFGDVARKSGTTDKRVREVTACDPKYKDISGVMCE